MRVGRLVGRILAVVILGAVAAPVLPVRPAAAVGCPPTFVVTSVGDGGFGPGELREGIECVNFSLTTAIWFAIGPPGSQQTITPASPLPAVTDAVLIDGNTQGGPSYAG